MGAPTAQTQRMSMEDWLERFSEAPFDYIDGHLIHWLPSPAGTSHTANLLRDALIEAEEKGKLGLAYIGVVLVYLDEDLIRTCLTPNLIFISHEREKAFRDQYPHNWKILPLMAVPELAVEVISPTTAIPM
ncbi:MAG: Uma2 family endonuclease [Anaerolineae bacterium]|jgi:Uma2 family endonuclease|nr:Uma2 family endonuclease [Anaerolineae bacterium]